MRVYNYNRQVKAVTLIHIVIFSFMFSVAFSFWGMMCGITWKSCLTNYETVSPIWFFILSAIRPLVFTPTFILELIAGDTFGYFWGTLYAVIGNVLSALVIYFPSKYLGRKMVTPFLATNLPQTWRLIRTQDYKVILALRLIPVFPFDISTFASGLLDFRLKSLLWTTFIGMIPESFLFVNISKNTNASLIGESFKTLFFLSIVVVTVLMLYEFLSRKKGSGLWQRFLRTYNEIQDEVKANNEINKRYEFKSDRTPVLLLYGFFSSRRTLTILERQLNQQGHPVLTFNLGGVLGVFFTRGILDTARYVNLKIKRQFRRHGFKKIIIVAHSKGGLVGLWWVLKLGGYKYCDLVITMATPFRGSNASYLALVTPLGFFWRDVWQMRPGSSFLRNIRDSIIPENLNIYCFYSDRDKVAVGTSGLFRTKVKTDKIHPMFMPGIAHFEFLMRRDVTQKIDEIIRRHIKEPSSESQNVAVG